MNSHYLPNGSSCIKIQCDTDHIMDTGWFDKSYQDYSEVNYILQHIHMFLRFFLLHHSQQIHIIYLPVSFRVASLVLGQSYKVAILKDVLEIVWYLATTNTLNHEPCTSYAGTMMTLSNGNIFCAPGFLWGKSTSHQLIPSQRPVMWRFDVFLDLCQSKCLSKQLKCWWFEMTSCSLCCHCNDTVLVIIRMIFFFKNWVIKWN